jgi:hypothetical protein
MKMEIALIVMGALLAISEVLPASSKIKSNSVCQLIVATIKSVLGFLKKPAEQK